MSIRVTRRGVRLIVPAAVAAAALGFGLLPAGARGTSPAPVRAAAPAAVQAAAGTSVVDVAPSGATATATSAADGHPASAAIDGDAGTTWCATQWQGTVTVDLGRVRTLTGLGVTLGTATGSSTASIETSTGAGRWRAVGAARSIVLEPNTPSYVPLPKGTSLRAARITVSTGDGTPACIGAFRLFGPDGATAGMSLGADLSFAHQEQQAGVRFSDAGRTSTPVQILSDNGGNYVRMRLWVNPPPGYSDLAADLALARQVVRAGMRVYLDIHYSDFWADPQHQDTPAAWVGQDLPTLARTVRGYTRQVLGAFARQHTPVSMVSIGNEIRNGMLWPTGELDWTADTGWDNLATLLKAGVAGARAGNPAGNPLRIMLHFDQGGDAVDSARFFGNLIKRGVPFDVIGLSYYPFWHGTPSDLRTNVDALATRFGKDVMIAETQYAWTLANGDSTGNFVWQASQLSAGYPASPGGQLSLIEDLRSILAAVPGGHGAGLFYWEPDWVPGVGWEPGAGAPNDNLTMFDFQGRALPSMGFLQDPVRVCERYDRGQVPCVVPGA